MLCQLNHRDSLQISQAAASVPCAASPEALALAMALGGDQVLACPPHYIPKARLLRAGLVVRDIRVLKYFY